MVRIEVEGQAVPELLELYLGTLVIAPIETKDGENQSKAI